MKKKIVLISQGPIHANPANSERDLVRYSKDEIVAIIDPPNAGKTTEQFFGFGSPIPVVSQLEEVLDLKPNYLLLGAFPHGNSIKSEWFPIIIKALQSGLNILNGLHRPLNDVQEFDVLSKRHNNKIINLRSAGKTDQQYITGNLRSIYKVLTVGIEPFAGELAATIELYNAIRKKRKSAKWLPTSVCGNLINKNGFIAESQECEYLSAKIEQGLSNLSHKANYILVEGSGSIMDKGFSAEAIGILHGASPDAILYCAKAGRNDITRLKVKIKHALEAYQKLLSTNGGYHALGLILDTTGLDDEYSMKLMRSLSEEFDFPVSDLFRFGMDDIVRNLLLN
jgi:uncharacterized NAD-dependent epimerase/dehydratase family protein